MKYAVNTSVASDKSQGEIKSTLQRYGAAKYAYFEEDERSAIVFEFNNRRLRFDLPLPSRMADEFLYRHYAGEKTGTVLPVAKQHERWEQACRQRWRALALCIKAKLEAVESGITTFEEEFLSHIVMANGQTIGEFVVPQVAQICDSGTLPKLLPGIGETGNGSKGAKVHGS